jgi:hypothetical protein
MYKLENLYTCVCRTRDGEEHMAAITVLEHMVAITVLEFFKAKLLQRRKKQEKCLKAIVTRKPLSGSDVPTEILMKIYIFRDDTPCRLVNIY